MRSGNNETRMHFLRRTAKEVRQYRVTMKILATSLACIVSLVGIIYVCAALYENTGAFTVNLNKAEMTKYGLSLSETEDMRYKTSHLDASIAENMTNIDGKKTIPENVDNVDGEHNGDDYIAYTFYVQNAGREKVSYEYALEMSNISNGLDDAIRARVYVNGVPTTYGKAPQSDAAKEDDVDENFYSGTQVMRGRVDDFEVNEKTKFTVVIWIEGNDPECLDFVLGGQVKFEMRMSIIE